VEDRLVQAQMGHVAVHDQNDFFYVLG
jgi:hypothetical protein